MIDDEHEWPSVRLIRLDRITVSAVAWKKPCGFLDSRKEGMDWLVSIRPFYQTGPDRT